MKFVTFDIIFMLLCLLVQFNALQTTGFQLQISDRFKRNLWNSRCFFFFFTRRRKPFSLSYYNLYQLLVSHDSIIVLHFNRIGYLIEIIDILPILQSNNMLQNVFNGPVFLFSVDYLNNYNIKLPTINFML